MPKVRKDLKTKFQNEAVERTKLNYLRGGDGGGGDDGGSQGGTGSWPP